MTLDYTSLNGGEPVTLTPAQIIDGWQAVLGAYEATQHLFGNHLVTIVGDTAAKGRGPGFRTGRCGECRGGWPTGVR